MFKRSLAVGISFALVFSVHLHDLRGCNWGSNYAVDTYVVMSEGNCGEFKLSSIQARTLEKNGMAVERNQILEGFSVETKQPEPDDSMEYEAPEYEWNLGAVRAKEYVDEEAGEAKIKVAVLDSGVNYSPEIPLKDSVSIIDTEGMSMGALILCDSTGHGTAVASLITGKSTTGSIQGMNEDAELYSVKVLGADNRGTLSDVVKGIYWCIDNDMDIINMSFGTMTDSKILHTAVQDAYDAGILIVAAAGNTGSEEVAYPAAYQETVSVGASTMTGELAESSAYGRGVDVYAPGEDIAVDSPLMGVQMAAGTSIACAEVSAAASVVLEREPALTADELREKLVNGSNKNFHPANTDTEETGGLLDVEEAINYSVGNGDQENKAGREDRQPDTGKPIPAYDENEVRALWHSANRNVEGHKDTIPTDVDVNGYRLMYAASIFPDSKNWYDGENDDKDNPLQKCRCFHGSGKYWETITYLVDLAHAYYIKDGELVEKIKNDAQNTCVFKFKSGKSIGKEDKGISVYEAVDDYLKNTNCFRNPALKDDSTKGYLYVEVNESTYHNQAYKLMGLAIHTIGDTYAHRTIFKEEYFDIMEAYFEDTGNAYISSGQKTEFEKKVVAAKKANKTDVNSEALDDVETRRINKYFKKDVEDDTKFIPARFRAAKNTVRRLVGNGEDYDFREKSWSRNNVLYNYGILRCYAVKDYKKCIDCIHCKTK